MQKLKLIKIIASIFLVCAVAVVGFLKWYSHPANVIKRISDIETPFFSGAEYESVQESWQDSHITYVLKVSKSFSSEFFEKCENLGGKIAKMNYRELNSEIVTAMESLTEGGISSGCQIKAERGDESWELVVEGRGLFFDYYFYDRP